jgi:hypothetical protein
MAKRVRIYTNFSSSVRILIRFFGDSALDLGTI